MFKTRQPNPIFDRALQHSRWPSLRTTEFEAWIVGIRIRDFEEVPYCE